MANPESQNNDPVDVEQLTCEVEPGNKLALHRLQVHVAQTDTATGDKFVLVEAFPPHRKSPVRDLLRQISLQLAR